MENKTKKDEIDDRHFLFGLINAFANRLQTVGDRFLEEISWKQWFVIIGIELYKEPPTINEVANIIGSSHQNVKQILIKLEKMGYVAMHTDEDDRRKQRIRLTEKKKEIDDKYNEKSMEFMNGLYHGLDDKDIAVTIRTLLTMEENLE